MKRAFRYLFGGNYIAPLLFIEGDFDQKITHNGLSKLGFYKTTEDAGDFFYIYSKNNKRIWVRKDGYCILAFANIFYGIIKFKKTMHLFN